MKAAFLALLLAAPASAGTSPFSAEEFKEMTDGALAVPPLARAGVLAAAQLQKMKRPSAAAKAYGAAARRAPGSWVLRVAQGAAYMEAGDSAKALPVLLKAAELNPKSSFPRRLVADALWELKRAPEAEAEARAAVKLNPLDARSRALLGKILRAGGRWAEAVSELKAAQELDKSYSYIDLELGLAYGKLGRADEAELHLQLFLALCGLPADHPAVRLAKERQARPAGASGGGAAGVGDGPQQDALVARTMLELGDLDECERLAARSLAAAPRYAPAHYVYGHLHARRGRGAQALASLSEAVALDPGNAGYRLTLARGLRSAKRWDEAIRETKIVLRMAPDWAPAQLNLAVCSGAAGDEAATWAAARRAVELDPYDGEALAFLGHMFRQAGRHEEAIPILDRAQHAMPLLPQPEFDLGMARKALGQNYAAEYHLRNFLRMTEKSRAPDDRWRLEAKAALDAVR